MGYCQPGRCGSGRVFYDLAIVLKFPGIFCAMCTMHKTFPDLTALLYIPTKKG